MEIKRIQLYSQATHYLSSPKSHIKPKFYTQNSGVRYFNLYTDKFEKSQDLTFTSTSVVNKAIQNYIRKTSLNNSLTHSKRPYLSIDEELVPIIKTVNIPVSKKENIQAFEFNPNNSNKYLLFLHGFSQNLTSNQPLYKALKNSDFGVLAIDYRGYGQNKKSTNTNERGLLQDMKSAVKYLNEKGITDVGVLGHSFGGFLATKLSKSIPMSFQILVSPMLSLEFWLKNVIKKPTKYKHENLLINFIPGFKDQYRKIFDITKSMEGNFTPTYVIQAFKDRYIRTSKVNDFVKKINNLQEYKIIYQGGHRMDDFKISAIIETLKKLSNH